MRQGASMAILAKLAPAHREITSALERVDVALLDEDIGHAGIWLSRAHVTTWYVVLCAVDLPKDCRSFLRLDESASTHWNGVVELHGDPILKIVVLHTIRRRIPAVTCPDVVHTTGSCDSRHVVLLCSTCVAQPVLRRSLGEAKGEEDVSANLVSPFEQKQQHVPYRA